MHKNIPRIPREYVVTLNMNGLRGRMLRLPAKRNKKREILLVYGHHSSLERMYSIAEALSAYGSVTLPDLPGFGGMDSFYKIGEKPDMDTMADYLASVIKLRYKNRRLTIVGLSYGFGVVTRMLQLYPDIAKKVDLLVSVVGFAHHQDFVFSKRRLRLYKIACRLLSFRLSAILFRNIALHPLVIKYVYTKTHNAKHKFDGLDNDDFKALVEFETYLWRTNDLRTHMYTTHQMLTLDNCQSKVALPVWHIGVDADNYFDNGVVEQHMRVVFEDFYFVKAPFDKHMPNVIASKKEVSKLLPRRLRQELAKS